MSAPLLELAHDHVQQMCDAFTRPDDDWPPTLMLECAHGERTVVVIANGATGTALALTIQTVLAHSGAVRAVLVT